MPLGTPEARAKYAREWRARQKAAHPEAYRARERARYARKRALHLARERAAGRAKSARRRTKLGMALYTPEYRAMSRRAVAAFKTRYPERFREMMKRGKAKYRATPHGAAMQRADNQNRRARIKANGGTITAAQWRWACECDGYKCEYCGSQLNEKTVTMDHIIPLSKGGAHELGNVVPACRGCNSRKGARTPIAARAA